MSWRMVNLKRRRRNVKRLCPECKDSSEETLRFRPECKNHFDLYHCKLCQNEWDPSEVIEEEYKVARFMGRDGEWKFIIHTDSNQRKMRKNTNMWNPKVLNNKRDAKGKFTGRMSRKDSNLLRRLRGK